MRLRHRGFTSRTLRLTMFVVLICQFGCGVKVSDVLTKYQADFKTKREQFQTISRALPAKTVEKSCSGLNPPIQYNETTKQFNTEIVAADQLLDPDGEPQFDFHMSKFLLLGIRWTGPKSPMSPSSLKNRGEDMEKDLKAALGYRYMIVNRVVALKNPIAVDEKTYTPGRVTMNVLIVNLATNEVVCGFTLQAQSATETSYYYKSGESKKDRLQDFAFSSMWEDARKKLIAGLKQTGADIEIK